MIQLNPKRVPYIMFMILKCTTIRLGLSVGIWGTSNPGADPTQCPSYVAIKAIDKCFPRVEGINYGRNDLRFGCFNSRTICKHDPKGHCLVWTIEEGKFLAAVLCIFSWVCAMIGIPIIFPCFGGTSACDPFFTAFKQVLQEFYGSVYASIMKRYVHYVPDGTHVSNLRLRLRATMTYCVKWRCRLPRFPLQNA